MPVLQQLLQQPVEAAEVAPRDDDDDAAAEPTGNEVLRNLFRDRSPAGIVGGCEAFLGLAVSGFVAFCVVGIVGAAALFNAWTAGYPRLERGLLVALTVAWLPLAVAEWRSVVRYAAGLARAPHPVPVHLALAMLRPGPALPVRVAVALWWLANGAAVVLLARWFAGQLSFHAPTTAERVIQVGVPVLVMFGAAFACNTHLLIALHALTGSERLVRGVWRVRVVLDLALTLLVPAVSLRVLDVT